VNDLKTYLQSLEQRGYQLETLGKSHVDVRWQGTRVAVAPSTSRSRRALENLKGYVRRFEQSTSAG
jgi:G:T/U-mismatch repair DNA glycosylase